MSGRSRDYKADLYRSLQDDVEAAYYLKAALDDSQPAFLVALRNVVEARNLSKVARESTIDRAHLYRILSESGNPTIDSLEKILRALGFRLGIDVDETQVPPQAAASVVWQTVWQVSSTQRKGATVYAVVGGDEHSATEVVLSREDTSLVLAGVGEHVRVGRGGECEEALEMAY